MYLYIIYAYIYLYILCRNTVCVVYYVWRQLLVYFSVRKKTKKRKRKTLCTMIKCHMIMY